MMKKLLLIATLFSLTLSFQSCGGDDGGDGPAPPPDGDNDGIADTRDQCPNTPAGATVNSVGCSASQRDTDNDGVKDNLDQCDNTPAGETVDGNGCSESQKDDDQDGVNNANDKCLNTAGSSNWQGCPELIAAKSTFPVNNDVCVPDTNGQITHRADAGSGGSGNLEYRLHYADNKDFNNEQTSAWSAALTFAQTVTPGNSVWAFWETRDDVGNTRNDATIRFRPEPDASSITAPQPASNISVTNNGNGTADVTWTEAESNLNADVYVLAQGVTDYSIATPEQTNVTTKTATVNVNSGTWNLAVVLKKQFNNDTQTWRFEVSSYKQFNIP